VNITRTFTLQPLKSTVPLAFSAQELKTMFGKQLTVTVGGPISGTLPTNIVQVFPSQIIDVKTRLDMTVCTEENACTP
jgi:hypothetical protein